MEKKLIIFADPYPDELLYGAFARYHARMGYPRTRYTYGDLFGHPKTTINPYFPKYLDYLMRVLPFGHQYTSDQLIDNHTALPYYAPFLPSDRINSIRDQMKKGGRLNFLSSVGATQSQLQLPLYLRSCPLCDQEDKEKYGETYWHRLHQLNGVEVCVLHNTWLEQSNKPLFGDKHQIRAKHLISSEDTTKKAIPRNIDLLDPSQQVLFQLAKDIDWLIHQPNLFSWENLNQKYLSLLGARGFAKSKVHFVQLVNAIKEKYPNRLFSLLGLGDTDSSEKWLKNIFYNVGVTSPLYHLLLINFLGLAAREFFAIDSKTGTLPFGEGPWPCMNPVCIHYMQPFAQLIKLEKPTFKLNYFRGTFSCDCGFTYSRLRAYGKLNNFSLVRKVDSYGQLWENEFKRAWKDNTMSDRAFIRMFHMAPKTLMTQAERLGLGLERVLNVSRKKAEKKTGISGNNVQVMVRHREIILDAIRVNPNATRSILVESYGSSYRWLKKHDNEWFNSHIPPIVIRHGAENDDLEKMDIEFAAKIRSIANEIRNGNTSYLKVKQHNRGFIYLTSTRLAILAGCKSWLIRYPDKFTLSRQELAENTETETEFLLRKIRYYQEYYGKIGVIPTKTQIMRDVSLYSHLNKPELREAIRSLFASYNITIVEIGE